MLRLGYGSLVIAVEGGDRAPLAWLREFLGATFDDPAPSAPPHHTVRIDPAPSPSAARGPSEETDVFSLDGSFVRLPATRAPDGSLVLRDAADRIDCVLRGPDVTIAAPGDGPALRLVLLRVIRELATAHALREGHLHVHAAAIDVRGAVVAIAGPRESGKTTLLIHALLRGAGRYVSNDRLLVDPGAEPPLARGMPTIVSLRQETLVRFPDFARRLDASGYARERTFAEAAALHAPARPNLSPAQFRTLAGAEEAGAGPLSAMVFPSIAPGVERFEVTALRVDEAAARIRKGLFLAALPERPATAFSVGTPPRDGEALDRLCRDLATRIACLAVRLGPRAYEAPAIWDAIGERLP